MRGGPRAGLYSSDPVHTFAEGGNGQVHECWWWCVLLALARSMCAAVLLGLARSMCAAGDVYCWGWPGPCACVLLVVCTAGAGQIHVSCWWCVLLAAGAGQIHAHTPQKSKLVCLYSTAAAAEAVIQANHRGGGHSLHLIPQRIITLFIR